MSVESNNYIEFGNKSHTGLTEEHNSDQTGVFNTRNGSLFVVCGGIRDKTGSSIASKIAVKSIGDYFNNKKFKNLQKALYNAVLFANQQIFEQAGKSPNLKGMATTIAVVLLSGKNVFYSYVGNSRIYLLKQGKLLPLTKDHTVVQQLLDAGTIKQEETKNHPEKEKLTNILGISRDLQFSINKVPLILNDNDQILLASDGLTNQLSDDEIVKNLEEEDISVEHKSAKLIDKANAKGGKDNVSVILIRYDANLPLNDIKPVKKLNPLFVVIPLLAILIGIGIYFLVANKLPQKAYTYLVETFKKEDVGIDLSESVINDTIANNLDSTTVILPDLVMNLLRDTVIKYKIAKDENLYRIGLHFNIPADTLAKYNNISAVSISDGQDINIPVKGVYVVKESDFIYQLAQKFNVDYKSIINANKLNTYEYLVEGSELYIPYKKGEFQLN